MKRQKFIPLEKTADFNLSRFNSSLLAAIPFEKFGFDTPQLAAGRFIRRTIRKQRSLTGFIPKRELEFVDEDREWMSLTPAQRIKETTKLWQLYLALGGSLDPEPDTQSPFYFKVA